MTFGQSDHQYYKSNYDRENNPWLIAYHYRHKSRDLNALPVIKMSQQTKMILLPPINSLSGWFHVKPQTPNVVVPWN